MSIFGLSIEQANKLAEKQALLNNVTTMLNDSDWTQLDETRLRKDPYVTSQYFLYRRYLRDCINKISLGVDVVVPSTFIEGVSTLSQVYPNQDIDFYKSAYSTCITQMYDVVYLKAVPTSGKLQEYLMAETEAKAYMADNSVVGPTVYSWAMAKGWTLDQAAADILTAAAKLRGLMYFIRDQRLKAPQQIASCTSMADIESIMQDQITKVRGLILQV